MSDQCIARPLIYVDVSLHSNKKKTRKVKALVCLLNVSQGYRLSIMQLPIAGLRGWPFMWLQELSGIEASRAPRFYVWAHLFLSNKTPLHVITCRSPQMLSLHKFEGRKKGGLCLENKRGRMLKHNGHIIESVKVCVKENVSLLSHCTF